MTNQGQERAAAPYNPLYTTSPVIWNCGLPHIPYRALIRCNELQRVSGHKYVHQPTTLSPVTDTTHLSFVQILHNVKRRWGCCARRGGICATHGSHRLYKRRVELITSPTLAPLRCRWVSVSPPLRHLLRAPRPSRWALVFTVEADPHRAYPQHHRVAEDHERRVAQLNIREAVAAVVVAGRGGAMVAW